MDMVIPSEFLSFLNRKTIVRKYISLNEVRSVKNVEMLQRMEIENEKHYKITHLLPSPNLPHCRFV